MDDLPAQVDHRHAAATERLILSATGGIGLDIHFAIGDAVLGERLEILLVDAAPELGPELGPGPRPVIADAMAQARVILRLSAWGFFAEGAAE